MTDTESQGYIYIIQYLPSRLDFPRADLGFGEALPQYPQSRA